MGAEWEERGGGEGEGRPPHWSLARWRPMGRPRSALVTWRAHKSFAPLFSPPFSFFFFAFLLLFFFSLSLSLSLWFLPFVRRFHRFFFRLAVRSFSSSFFFLSFFFWLLVSALLLLLFSWMLLEIYLLRGVF